MRIKTRWHNKGKARSPREMASTLAFIAWRVAANAVSSMEKAGFMFPSNVVRLRVVEEFVAFLIQVVDRLVHERVDDETRERLVQALALRLVDTTVENRVEILGPGDYRGALIGQFNERLDDYSDLSFSDEGPGFGFLRYLGDKVEAALAGQDSRWAVAQVVEIEAPEAVKTIRKALEGVEKASAAGG